MNNDILNEFHQLYSKGSIDECIDLLSKVDPARYGNKIKKRFAEPDFLNSLVANPSTFQHIFQSKYSDELLHEYFQHSKSKHSDYEAKLISEYPDAYIQAIRVNQVFLRDDRIEELIAVASESRFKLHQEVWSSLYSKENAIWTSICNKLDAISDISLSDVLTQTTIWLENERFANSSDQDVHHLASTYSRFINLYLNKYACNDVVLNIEEFNNRFINKINSTSVINESLSQLLSKISEWVSFYDITINPYCFDMNIDVVIEDKNVYLIQSKETQKKWKLDGLRYDVNHVQYTKYASEITQIAINEGRVSIPKGRIKEDYKINLENFKKEWQLRLLLDDLSIESLVFGNQKFPSTTLFRPFLALATNNLHRYEKHLKKYSTKSKDWITAFMKAHRSLVKKDITIHPYYITTKKEYLNIISDATNISSEKAAKAAVDLLSIKIKTKRINKLHLKYNVWIKPFIRFGEVLFCPTMFVANNDWFYASAIASLENMDYNDDERKKTSDNMEQKLGKVFSSKSWKVKVTNVKEASNINGDVDVIVEDGGTVLFIQLKRTKLRLNPQDAYNETVMVDRKAKQQLNDAERFLTVPNNIYNLKGRDPIKWIVTTSYEGILSEIDGCVKVNYFDILHALRNYKLKSLNDLVSFMMNDDILKSHYGVDYPVINTTNHK